MQRSAISRKPKPKRCKWCKETFTPTRMGQDACKPFPCAVELGRIKDAKKREKASREQKRMDRKRLDKLKSRSEWAKEAQAAVNAYVRLRDHGKPCISCGKPDDGSHQRHASHYRSVGACSQLRFNLRNIHASCAQCNSAKSGNLIEYRIALCNKFGEWLPLWLESKNEPTRYSLEYLKRLKKVFTNRVRQKKNRIGRK